jgi:hypothetical protein
VVQGGDHGCRGAYEAYLKAWSRMSKQPEFFTCTRDEFMDELVHR